MRKSLLILIFLAAVLIGGVLVLKSQNIGAKFLWDLSNDGRWLFPLVAAGALIDAINICAFSVLILTIAFLFNLGKIRLRILEIGGAYIFGIFLVYILIGLGILKALYLFNTPNFMAKVGASLLILLGAINLLNEFFPSFPIKLKIPQTAHHKMAELIEKGSLPTAFLLGGFVGLCEFPCTGGPYLMVLGLLHDHATFLKGLGYLLFYNFLFVLPLLIILLIASNKIVAERIQSWKKEESGKLRFLSGAAMIILGIIIFII